jgi:hypothetical protein
VSDPLFWPFILAWGKGKTEDLAKGLNKALEAQKETVR